jgi:hypothetical protein
MRVSRPLHGVGEDRPTRPGLASRNTTPGSCVDRHDAVEVDENRGRLSRHITRSQE